MPASQERIHGIDAARAAAMFLGIALHASMAYTTTPEEAWRVSDPSKSVFFDTLIYVTHNFRMQAFFMIAGFFAAMVISTKGSAYFVKNRAIRIALPLVLGLATIGPITQLAKIYAGDRCGFGAATPSIWAAFTAYYAENGLRAMRSPIHLWFLEFLLVMYTAAFAGRTVSRVLPRAFLNALDRIGDRLFRTAWSPVIMGCLTLPLVIGVHDWMIDGGRGVRPWIGLIPSLLLGMCYHLTFFSFGWAWWKRRREGVAIYSRLGPVWFIGSCIAPLAIVLWLLPAARALQPDDPHNFTLGMTMKCLWNFAAWFGALGFIGMFLRWFRRPSAAWRYAADASYWAYLAHMPIVIALGGLTYNWGLNCFEKFAIVVALTGAVLLVTYHFGVRYTPIGWILNGRRGEQSHPKTRTNPQPAVAPTPMPQQ